MEDARAAPIPFHHLDSFMSPSLTKSFTGTLSGTGRRFYCVGLIIEAISSCYKRSQVQQTVARKSCLGSNSLFCGPKRTGCILNLLGTHSQVMIIQIRMRLTFDLQFIAACRLDLPYFIYFLSQDSRFNPGIVFFCQLFFFERFPCSCLQLASRIKPVSMAIILYIWFGTPH